MPEPYEMDATKAIDGLRYIDSMEAKDLLLLLANGGTIAGKRTVKLYKENIKLFYDTHIEDSYVDTYHHYGFFVYIDLVGNGAIYDLIKSYKATGHNPIIIPHNVIMSDYDNDFKDPGVYTSTNIIYMDKKGSIMDEDVARKLEQLIMSLKDLTSIYEVHA